MPEQVAKAWEIIQALTGIPDFPTPTLATATPVTGDLDTAANEKEVAKQAAEAKTAAQKSEDVFDRTFSQLAAYLESVAGDNVRMTRSVS